MLATSSIRTVRYRSAERTGYFSERVPFQPYGQRLIYTNEPVRRMTHLAKIRFGGPGRAVHHLPIASSFCNPARMSWSRSAKLARTRSRTTATAAMERASWRSKCASGDMETVARRRINCASVGGQLSPCFPQDLRTPLPAEDGTSGKQRPAPSKAQDMDMKVLPAQWIDDST